MSPRHYRVVLSQLKIFDEWNKVETFLQTRNSGNKDTNYMLAILDSRSNFGRIFKTETERGRYLMTWSRMKFVAHERFQYVLLKKFGELILIRFRFYVLVVEIVNIDKVILIHVNKAFR